MNNLFESFWGCLFAGLMLLSISCEDGSWIGALYSTAFLSLAVTNAHRYFNREKKNEL